jgi:hypothetical protein
MVRTNLLFQSLCLGILTLASSNLVAENPQNAKSPQVSVTVGSPVIHPSNAPIPGVQVLYSNLGSKTDTYTDGSGWTISGPDSVLGFSQAIAIPWTPTTNSTIQGLQVAMQWAGDGTNNGAVAVFSDDNGLPGKPLKVWNPSNLPTFGTCCALVTVEDKSGIKAAAGTQYWIAVGTDNGSTTAYDVWDFTWNEITGTVAFEGNVSTNGVWETFTGTLPAFAIYGTSP